MYMANAGCPFARVGTTLNVRPGMKVTVARTRRAMSRPWYSKLAGGMENRTSSTSGPISASRSDRSSASISRATSWCSAALSGWRAGLLLPDSARWLWPGLV